VEPKRGNVRGNSSDVKPTRIRRKENVLNEKNQTKNGEEKERARSELRGRAIVKRPKVSKNHQRGKRRKGVEV